MRERINRLAKGIIDMETPKLRIQPETLNEEIHPGEPGPERTVSDQVKTDCMSRADLFFQSAGAAGGKLLRRSEKPHKL